MLFAILFISSFSSYSTIYQVPKVVISDNRSEQSQVSTPAQIQVISEVAIERSGAQNIPELLQGQLGIQVIQLSGDESQSLFSMRGFAENAHSNVLILVDGRRLNGIDIATPDFSTIDISAIKRIEIIQGSHGTLYGDQAVAGVINIISKRPEKFRAQVQVNGGSYDTLKGKATISDRLDNGLAYRILAERKQSDNYRQRSDIEHDNFLAHLNYKNEIGEYFIELQYSDRYQQMPGAISNALVKDNRRQAAFANDFVDNQTYLASLVIRHQLSDDLLWESEITARDTDVNLSLANFAMQQFRNVYSFTPRIVYSFDWFDKEHLLTTGIDYQYTDYRLRSNFLPTDANQHNNALYAQLVSTLNSKLTSTVGARYARYDAEVNQVNFDDDIVVGELGLTYKHNEDLTLFARIDGNFRYPKVDEQSFTTNKTGDLEIQSGLSYEAGFQWVYEKLKLDVLLYWLQLKNEVIYDPMIARVGTPIPGANTNLDATERKGFNIYAEYQINNQITVSSNYHFVDGKMTDGPFTGNKIPFVSEHVLKNQVHFRPKELWHTYLEMITTSNKPAGNDNANQLRRLGGTTLFNGAISYDLSPIKVQLRVNNITDKSHHHYVIAMGNQLLFYPAPERNVMIEVNYLME